MERRGQIVVETQLDAANNARPRRRRRRRPGHPGGGAREAVPAVLLDQAARQRPRAGDRAPDHRRARRQHRRRRQHAAGHAVYNRVAVLTRTSRLAVHVLILRRSAFTSAFHANTNTNRTRETNHPDRRRRAGRAHRAERRAARRGLQRRSRVERRRLPRARHARRRRSDRPRRLAAGHGRPGDAGAPARAPGRRAGRADLRPRQHRVGGARDQDGRLRLRREAAVAREDRAGRPQRAAPAPPRGREPRAARPRRSPPDDGRRELRDAAAARAGGDGGADQRPRADLRRERHRQGAGRAHRSTR